MIDHDLSPSDNPKFFRALFLLFSVFIFLLFALPVFIPVVDLPQHAAQISMWKLLDAGELVDPEMYELNLFTPYLGGYFVARALAVLMGVQKAVHATLYLSVILSLLALYYGVRDKPFIRWGTFLFIPFLFGWSFYWGFMNFMFAIGPCLFLTFFTMKLTERVPDKVPYIIALFAVVLFFMHALLSLMFIGITVFHLLTTTERIKPCLVTSVALIPYVVIVISWTSATKSSGPLSNIRYIWGLGLHRILILPTTMFSGAYYNYGIALLTLLLIIAAFLIGFLQFKMCKRRGFAALLVMLAYLLLPHFGFGTFFIYQRFSSLIFPFLLFGFVGFRRNNLVMNRMFQSVCVIIPLIYLLSVALVFRGFSEETKCITSVFDKMEKNKKVLSLVYDRSCHSVNGPALLHFPVWYQAASGGRVDFSFAYFFPQLIRFKEGQQILANDSFVWHPQRLDWKKFPAYDYYIMRTPVPVEKFPHPEAQEDTVLVCRVGKWHLFRAEGSADE